MIDLFTSVLNMSITASYIAVAVVIVRIIFKKAPKIFSYILWSAVFIRLILPFSFKSPFSFLSLFKSNTPASNYIPHNIGFITNPIINVGNTSVNSIVNSSLPAATPMVSVNPMQVLMGIVSIIWLIGIAVLLIYSIISYIKVKNKVKTATLVKDNVFETDRITTPFLLGLVNPKIYVPVGLSQNELSYVIAHEQTHIKRIDYIIKPVAYLLVIIHWFNPLMWLSFVLMSKDMEMSCDESVIKKFGNDIKSSYSTSLLSLSVKQNGLILANPLAFGESNIKSRIKNIVSYKKPTAWIVVLMTVVTTTMLVGLTTNPKTAINSSSKPSKPSIKYSEISTTQNKDIIKVSPDSVAKNLPYNPKIKKVAVNLPYNPKSKKGKTILISEPSMQKLSSGYKISPDEKIEQNLKLIMSSPLQSSNPNDYISAHSKEYENIIKMGDDALNYLLSQFSNGTKNDLRGNIMMALCKQLLGTRNNVTDNSLSPQEWYSKLKITSITKLP